MIKNLVLNNEMSQLSLDPSDPTAGIYAVSDTIDPRMKIKCALLSESRQ